MTDTTRDEARVIDALRRIVRALRTSGGVAERRAGLSAAQLFVLQQLNAKPEQSVSELMARTLTSQSSVSEVVARLVAQRMVSRRRASDDGRRVVLAITPRGLATLRSAPQSAQARLIDGLRSMKAAQRRQLGTLLGKWLSASGIARVQASMFFEESADGKRPTARGGRDTLR
jgi:DNA-binding MarR family transcriptional regulator